MRTLTLSVLAALLLPWAGADIIVLMTGQRVDGVISKYDSGQLTLLPTHATGEVRIQIAQVRNFTIVRVPSGPRNPMPLSTGPRSDDMRQRGEERRKTLRNNQIANRYNELMKQGDALRAQAFNIQTENNRPGRSRIDAQQGARQAQVLNAQAEQLYAEARTLQQQLETAGYRVERVPPSAATSTDAGTLVPGEPPSQVVPPPGIELPPR